MISVVIADDQELVRAGLHLILGAQEDITVVAEAGDGESAVREVQRHRPDVALLDVQMPGVDGLEAARRIIDDPANATRVIMLTTFDLDEYLYTALGLGACGFLLKSSPRANLLHAVRTAVAGEALLDPSLVRRLVEAYVHRPVSPLSPSDAPWSGLTTRERDIFSELARGRSNAEIARRLFLAETTVKSHVSSILRKLDLRDRVQAVVLGYESGLIRPGATSDP